MQDILATTALAMAASLPAGCVPATSGSPFAVPEKLKAPEGQVLALQVLATGVQIYACRPNSSDASRLDWIFKAPEAVLLDGTGRTIGTHYAGPTWEANDGSKVVGEIAARDDGPDANAIPWLLLKAKSASGNGTFARTQSIQRVRTVGGKAPTQACTLEQVGQEVRIPYSARYYFYGSQT